VNDINKIFKLISNVLSDGTSLSMFSKHDLDVLYKLSKQWRVTCHVLNTKYLVMTKKTHYQ